MPALGRLVDHDEHSRLYQAPKANSPRSVLWGHHAPVLDQGELGSCTGNATAQLINTDYFAAARKTHGYLGESDAVRIYELATRLDGIRDNTYPPTDGGSSGLGAAKAGVKLDYFTGYKHAFGFSHFAAAVQLQPVIVGTAWYDVMITPSKQGLVTPTGKVAGGHEYLCLGINYQTQLLTFLNSWGESWAQGGRWGASCAIVCANVLNSCVKPGANPTPKLTNAVAIDDNPSTSGGSSGVKASAACLIAAKNVVSACCPPADWVHT